MSEVITPDFVVSAFPSVSLVSFEMMCSAASRSRKHGQTAVSLLAGFLETHIQL